jgi:hypothetical protein
MMNANKRSKGGAGGFRANAGRKTNAQRLGKPPAPTTSKTTTQITDFFSSSRTMGNAASGDDNEDIVIANTENNEEEEDTQQQQQQQQQLVAVLVPAAEEEGAPAKQSGRAATTTSRKDDDDGSTAGGDDPGDEDPGDDPGDEPGDDHGSTGWNDYNSRTATEERSSARGQSKFTGLLASTIKNIDQSEMDKLVAKGVLWYTSTLDYVPTSSVRKIGESCWQLFIGYRIFNWRLEKMMGPGWKPNCVTCCSTADVKMHIRDRAPRLVYGLKTNYLLNSPEQWICESCRRVNATEKANNMDSSKRTQYTFSSHHLDVLEQLSREHPGIRYLFPCELGWRSAIDNDLVDLITSAANSGMGPSAVQQFVKSSHHHHHQSCELRWLQFLSDRLHNPTIHDHLHNLKATIEKLDPFPAYSSEEICGRVPSQSLLCDFYCKITHKRIPRMDALHQRLVSSSKLFCVDASYKVPKWLASINGEQMFSTLITMVDEDHIPLASYFAISDNHEEIKSSVAILQKFGWSPTVGFTDNVPRDEGFLVSNIRSLAIIRNKTSITSTSNDSDSVAPTNNNDPGGGACVLELRSPNPQFCTSSETAISALNLFHDNVQEMEDKVVSFDMEWSMYFDGTPPSQTAIVGFGSLCVKKVLMIHLAKIHHKTELLNRIASLFRDKDFLFVGFNIAGDVTKLRKDFPAVDFGKPRLRDLGYWCIYRGLLEYKKGGHTLDAASEKILKKTIPKEAHLRRSDIWTRHGQLGLEAQEYLARDVEGGLLIYHETKNLPDLSLRLKKSELKVGMEVDILSSRKTVVQPIASGVICQVGASNTRTMTGLPLPEGRVLVEIQKVFKPMSGLYYTQVGKRKCKCGSNDHKHGSTARWCDLRTFGDAQRIKPDPFTIVEDCCRLRKHHDHDDTAIVEGGAPLEEEQRKENEVPQEMTDSARVSSVVMNENEEEEAGSQLTGDLMFLPTTPEANKEALDLDLDLPAQAVVVLDSLLRDVEDDCCFTNCQEAGTDDEELGTTDNPDMEPTTTAAVLFDPLADILAGASARQTALAIETQPMMRKIIEDAHELAKQHQERSNSSANNTYNDVSVPRIIFGDVFHVMDRVKVPVHHDWKAAYFTAFREAVFMYDKDDKEKVQKVLQSKGKTWDQEVSFNFRYLARRVRRYIPPGAVVTARVRAVFDFFQDKVDGKTGKCLFGGKDAMKKKELVLEALSRGELSDPLHISLYVPEFHAGTNTPKQDSDGLPVWRCIRGTGAAENAHSQYTRAFGQVRAGPMYSCAVLRNHHHRKTMRAAMAHRPGFPQIYHFDSHLVDAVDQLSIDLFATAKYPNWPSFHEAVPTERSPFGIIPLVEDCGRGNLGPCEFVSPQLRFLASSMDSDLPYTPVGTREEKILFKKLLERTVNLALPLNNNTFHDLTSSWNKKYVVVPPSQEDKKVTIFPKYSRHLINAYKTWRINRSKADRIKEARESDLLRALKVNPGIRVPSFPLPKYPERVIAIPTRRRCKHHIPQLILPAQPRPVPQPPPGPVPSPQKRTIWQRQHTDILPQPAPPVNCSFGTRAHQEQDHPPKKKRGNKKCSHCGNDHCMRPWNRSGKCNNEPR